MGVRAREPAQHDWLRCAPEVLGQWDSSADCDVEGQWSTSAGLVTNTFNIQHVQRKVYSKDFLYIPAIT